MLSQLRERSLCLLNSDRLSPTFQPWFTIADAEFHSDVCALYSPTNINPIQSIQTDYLPPFISYLWPLVHHGHNVWAVDHCTTKDTNSTKFVLKYDLLIWNVFYCTNSISRPSMSNIVYPKVLILAPDWCTCETTYQHLTSVHTDVLQKLKICCIYEGKNIESELYQQLLTQGSCDLLIATPTIVQDLIQKRYIHFEQLQMIVYDQIDLLLRTIESIHEMFNHLHLHTNKSNCIQHVLLSRIVNQTTKDFLDQYLSNPNNYYYLSPSMLETYAYHNYFVYCEPCRNWSERKQIIKETLDLASHCRKKVVMCAYQTRRLATMQSILNDLSIQSVLIHSQLNSEEIEQYIHEWQTITDRPLILLIQDEVLQDINIDNTDIIIHLDVQRLLWYQLYNQRLKLIYKHLAQNDRIPSLKQSNLTSLKSMERFYQTNSSTSIPLLVLLWPGDCAQVTYELIDYLRHSQSYVHPLIERLARNNCHESILAKLNVEFCPTLKMFGQCQNENKLKRCPYRHHFHWDIDSIEQKGENEAIVNENYLSKSFELYLPQQGEIELRVTHVSDGNRLWAHVLRSRNDINQVLTKLFDYDRFEQEIEQAFQQVKHRPLSEIVLGDTYFYCDSTNRIHRVYVHEHEHTYFDLRRADAILNRLLKVSNAVNTVEKESDENQQLLTINKENTSSITDDRPPLTVFSLDTGRTFTLKSSEHLYPLEPSTLKQYPPLAIEIILCNIYPLDQITVTFTSYAIETLRSLTLNGVFMGRIQLATRSCLWIDPLVKPVRLAALNRIAYDKPIRKQLILAKLVQSNDNHMLILERLAVEAQLKEEPLQPSQSISQPEPEIVKECPSVFKPFLNRSGQLIINPLGRSKEFFSRHHQPSHDEFVQIAEDHRPLTREHEHVTLGRGYRLNAKSSVAETLPPRPQSISVTNAAIFPHSPVPSLIHTEQIDSTVTTPSEIGLTKMTDMKIKPEYIEEEIFEDTTDTNLRIDSTVPTESVSSEQKVISIDDADQMMFIFGPKLFSQLRQIKDMEDEQRRQADFPVQRNRHRHPRFNNAKAHQPDGNDETNGNQDEPVQPPNMSRYEPFVGERGSLTQVQIDYKQTQRKTRLFWEQTSRDIYLTIGFYNVDSTQTRVEFDETSIYCRTRIRNYDRFVRIYLAHEILPEKCSFQVRRSNILLTIRKVKEGLTWTALNNRPIEPRPEFFNVDYGSDDESETEKRRRTVNRQWEQIREDKRQCKSNQDEDKFTIDEIDHDEHPGQTDKLPNKNDDDDNNQQELTDTSSDCHSTDSDDCYYEDQVPANHIPRGYDDADYDHRFYGDHIRT